MTTAYDAHGNPMEWDLPDHIPHVTPIAGAAPYCSCGWGRGGWRGGPILAEHLAEMRKEASRPADSDRWAATIEEALGLD